MGSRTDLNTAVASRPKTRRAAPVQECALDGEAQYLEDIRASLREMREGKLHDSFESIAEIRKELGIQSDDDKANHRV